MGAQGWLSKVSKFACSGELLLLLFPSSIVTHIELIVLAFIFSCTIGQVHLLVNNNQESIYTLYRTHTNNYCNEYNYRHIIIHVHELI